MKEKLENIVKHKKSKWLKLGGKLATTIVTDADKGISQDKDGKKFPPYKNAKYKKLKKEGKLIKGVGISRQVTPPNLRLTGEMLGSIHPKNATADSVEIIYRSGKKVRGNANPVTKKPFSRKRNIWGLNDKNWNHAKNFIEKEINNNIKKFNKAYN